jgi:pimeloyl-ACP methyl ester carboxylesterase
MLRNKIGLVIGCLMAAVSLGSLRAHHQESVQAMPITPPQELWERCRTALPPLSFKIVKDEIVPSDTDQALTMKRIEVRFCSQVAGQWRMRMDHTAVIFLPAGPGLDPSPDRKGRVVLVSHAYGDKAVEGNYGEPIAARTGYPTMVIPIPGEYNGCNGESSWVYFCRSLVQDTKDPINALNFREAVAYLRALDVFAAVLGEKQVRAVIGGHSKRAPSAFLAAAMDPERISGVVYMGNESKLSQDVLDYLKPVSLYYAQKYVRCPVIYIGATNEDGYEMFNINRIQALLERPWTIDYIPNYRHANRSETQFMDWQMWVSHCFEGRPVTRISDLKYYETDEAKWPGPGYSPGSTGTMFECRIDTPNKIIMAKVWFIYCGDVPYWRDLMWFPVRMFRKEGTLFEGFNPGKLPDAWLVEVKDTSMGFPGYVTSLPQDITHKETKERYSQGSRSRLWQPKTGETAGYTRPNEVKRSETTATFVRDERPFQTPQELWERFKKTLPPFTYSIGKDEIVASDTNPRKLLRRVEVSFISQVVEGKKMGHRGVIYMPADPKANSSAERRGKVVIIADHRANLESVPGNYAEPIAARTGYPAMALLLPGDLDEEDGEVAWLRYFRPIAREKNDPLYHDFFRSAIPYVQAIDVFSGVLREKNMKAIIGGHSKRAYYAYNAAAIDPERVAGVVYMGLEALYKDEILYPPSVNPIYIQKFVKCPIFYIGATNEGGGQMFNINKLQQLMERPWFIEYIPNYRHEARSEKHFMDWQMWVSHIFDGRPLAKISELGFEETPEGTIFRARIETPNKMIQAKVWYVYCDDIPYWRDLVWYPEIMQNKEGSLFEGYVEGKLPDAWLVEVKDIANGCAGYISTLPQDITHKETKDRISHWAGGRLWEPKKGNEK